MGKTDDFICQNCRDVINAKILREYTYFGKLDFQRAIELEDNEYIQNDVNEEYIDISCSCGNPMVSDKDKQLLLCWGASIIVNSKEEL